MAKGLGNVCGWRHIFPGIGLMLTPEDLTEPGIFVRVFGIILPGIAVRMPATGVSGMARGLYPVPWSPHLTDCTRRSAAGYPLPGKKRGKTSMLFISRGEHLTMRHTPRKIAFLLIIVVLALLFLLPPVFAADVAPSPAVPANTTPAKVEVGIFVNSIKNLDFARGTYTMDYYVHFRWTDPAIPSSRFEVMNGQPSGANALVENFEDKSGPVKEEWYRVRSDFTITPNTRDYPFESGSLPIVIEDSSHDTTDMIYVPLANESGVDPAFELQGWSIGVPGFSVINHSYPWGESFSQLTFSVPVTKNATDSVVQTLIPPLIFCMVALISFFLSEEHRELIALRYGLTTSMFISAVMFNFSQLASLPGIGGLTLFEKFMISVYLFLAGTIVVTTLCYISLYTWKRPDLARRINWSGLAVSILVPVGVFWLLLAMA